MRKSLDRLSVPIIQGGMGIGISMGSLAGAVAAEGGMGVISTANIGFREPDYMTDTEAANTRALVREIKKAREISGSRGLVAINAMVATTNFTGMIRTAVRNGIDAVISGAGLPLELPDAAGGDVLIAPIVSGARAAKLITKHWAKRFGRKPDFTVVEGYKAGGHLGFKPEELESGAVQELAEAVHEVAESAEEPVFAAGGVFDVNDIKAMHREGAAGVQMATRFIATHECDATQGFKDVILEAKKEDVAVIKSPVGMPGRAVRTELIKKMESGIKAAPDKCVRCIKTCDPARTPYCINRVLISAFFGDRENGLFFCGDNVDRVNGMMSVHELIKELST